MRRYLLSKLNAWRVRKDRKPLILMGVRQTGKTYLLKQFGHEEFKQTHYLNFEEEPGLADIFDKNLDPKRIISEIGLYLKTPITLDEDLIIFDEIQAAPRALTSLKYFCEKLPECALCAAGSLLGLTLSEGSFPVGKVDIMHLYPMTFREFLEGIGEQMLSDYLSELNALSTISELIHRQLWDKLKCYFVTGGLPEVVAKFSVLKDDLFTAFSVVRKKQEELRHAYYADIAKHSGKVNAMHIDRVWSAVPAQLTRTQNGNASRFKFVNVVPGVNRYNRLSAAFDWLKAAELIRSVPLINQVHIPLSSMAKESQFKCFLFDVGMLGSMAGLNPETIFAYDYGMYKGYFAENFVLQELIATLERPLFSWQEGRSEVEFLLENRTEVVPIEVKSGSRINAKSLQKYHEKYSPRKRIILSARALDAGADRGLLKIPLYLAGQIESFL